MAIDKKNVIRTGLLCLCLLLAASTAMPVWAAEGSDVAGEGAVRPCLTLRHHSSDLLSAYSLCYGGF